MAVRPVYNGSARLGCDNNPANPALLNRFTFRATTGAAPNAGDELISNQTVDYTVGQTITLTYDIRKFGAGVEADTPTLGTISIYEDDTLTSIFTSADLINGNPLPRTGSITLTLPKSGTYRIQCLMSRTVNPVGLVWRADSDGNFATFAVTTMAQNAFADKGRLRTAMQLAAALTISERGNAKPNPFAFTMDPTGNFSQESVRVFANFNTTWQNSKSVNIKARRNGTSTIDSSMVPPETIVGGTNTTVQTDTKVNLINYPANNTTTAYDALVTLSAASSLHANNTPQYTGLAAQPASGNWAYFISAGFGNFIDYQTIGALNSYNVNPGGTIENIFAKSAATYTEVSGVPQGAEDFNFIATADNMTVKVGRVLNARNETLFGVFVYCEVIHDSSGQVRTTWGNNDINFVTLANGWVKTANIVVVSTPPAGIHDVQSQAYFPGAAFGSLPPREFSISLNESGSPAGASTGKNWIAPASFQSAVITDSPIVQAGSTINFSVHVFNKNAQGNIVEADADLVPPCTIYQRTASGPYTVFATPTLTKRAGTTGIYDGSFTPTAMNTGDALIVYEIDADVTVSSFLKRAGGSIAAIAFDLAGHTHTGADGAVAIGDRS